MSAAKHSGLDVPEFRLSHDQERFIIKRFDVLEDQSKLAVEDFTVLLDREKYVGSYESVMKVVDQATDTIEQLEKIYTYIVFKCLIGNGDAHLKNFALIYDQPNLRPAHNYQNPRPQLSPIYDVTNTMIYPTQDNKLALNVGKSKEPADRERLVKLADQYPMIDATRIIDRIADRITNYLDHTVRHKEIPKLKDEIMKTINRGTTRQYTTKAYPESGNKKFK